MNFTPRRTILVCRHHFFFLIAALVHLFLIKTGFNIRIWNNYVLTSRKILLFTATNRKRHPIEAGDHKFTWILDTVCVFPIKPTPKCFKIWSFKQFESVRLIKLSKLTANIYRDEVLYFFDNKSIKGSDAIIPWKSKLHT